VKDGRLVTCGHRWTRGTRTFMNGIGYFLPESTNGSGLFRSYQNPDLEPSSGPHPKNPKSRKPLPDYSHRLIPLLPLNAAGTAIDPRKNYSM
jgi:hypothetical protein